MIHGPNFLPPVDALRRRVEMALRARSDYPQGMRRQFDAILGTGSLLRYTRRITAPTVVIHGSDDPMVRPRNGRNLARAIPGARFVVVDGMGHDLPEPVWRPIVEVRSPRTSPWPADGRLQHQRQRVVDHDVQIVAERAGQPLLGQLGHRPGIHRGTDFGCHPVGFGGRGPALLGEDEFAYMVLGDGASGGQYRVGAGLGEQDLAAPRVGRAEIEHGADAGAQPFRSFGACAFTIAVVRMPLGEFSCHPVVDRTQQCVGVGKALVEIPGVQFGQARHTEHGEATASPPSPNKPKAAANQERAPLGLAVGTGGDTPAHRVALGIG